MGKKRPPFHPGPRPGPRYGHGPASGPGPKRSRGPVAGPARRPPPRKQPPVPDVAPDEPIAPSQERLHKFLAHAGLGSRRACEELILQGRVTVDGTVIRQLGTKIDPSSSRIEVDGEPVAAERLVYYAVHKPKGVVSTNSDPAGRTRVIDLIPDRPQRIYAVGRLDEASTGLILLTNDGELAQRLTHPRYRVPKTYKVLVAGRPEPEQLRQLTEGVWLSEGKAKAESVRIIGQQGQATWVELVLAEGMNREVRRMFAKLDHKVMRLVRIAVGPITLRGLSQGDWRKLTPREVNLLREATEPQGSRPRPRSDSGPRPPYRESRERPPRSSSLTPRSSAGPASRGPRPPRPPGAEERRPARRPAPPPGPPPRPRPAREDAGPPNPRRLPAGTPRPERPPGPRLGPSPAPGPGPKPGPRPRPTRSSPPQRQDDDLEREIREIDLRSLNLPPSPLKGKRGPRPPQRIVLGLEEIPTLKKRPVPRKLKIARPRPKPGLGPAASPGKRKPPGRKPSEPPPDPEI